MIALKSMYYIKKLFVKIVVVCYKTVLWFPVWQYKFRI
jgi:hypothetical protein